jgi:hypothetical protein
MASFFTSKYFTASMAADAIKDSVMPWLIIFCNDIIASSKIFAAHYYPKTNITASATISGFGSVGLTHGAIITFTGKDIEHKAVDYSFTVPAGGFQFGDINPKTGQPFPGGISKYGSYITLDDKPEKEGEAPKAVARTYSKLSGKSMTYPGFVSRALAQEIGHGIRMSIKGSARLHNLANRICMHIANSLVQVIEAEARSVGMTAHSTTIPFTMTIP